MIVNDTCHAYYCSIVCDPDLRIRYALPDLCCAYRTAELLRKSLNTNVVGVHITTQAFLPLLQRGLGKSIINTSSGSGSNSGGYSQVASPQLLIFDHQQSVAYVLHIFLVQCSWSRMSVLLQRMSV